MKYPAWINLFILRFKGTPPYEFIIKNLYAEDAFNMRVPPIRDIAGACISRNLETAKLSYAFVAEKNAIGLGNSLVPGAICNFNQHLSFRSLFK